MKLTKNQSKLYRRCVDAGVPEVFAALVAMRATAFNHCRPLKDTVALSFHWGWTLEGHDFWSSFDAAWEDEFLPDGTARRYE